MAAPRPKCTAITIKGTRCKNNAKPGMSVCGVHEKSSKKLGELAKARAKKAPARSTTPKPKTPSPAKVKAKDPKGKTATGGQTARSRASDRDERATAAADALHGSHAAVLQAQGRVLDTHENLVARVRTHALETDETKRAQMVRTLGQAEARYEKAIDDYHAARASLRSEALRQAQNTGFSVPEINRLAAETRERARAGDKTNAAKADRIERDSANHHGHDITLGSTIDRRVSDSIASSDAFIRHLQSKNWQGLRKRPSNANSGPAHFDAMSATERAQQITEWKNSPERASADVAAARARIARLQRSLVR